MWLQRSEDLDSSSRSSARRYLLVISCELLALDRDLLVVTRQAFVTFFVEE